jgi:nitrilase
MSNGLHSSSRAARPAGEAGEPRRARARVAAVQMVSGPEVAGNLREAGRLIEMAAARGAELIALPEYFPIMGMDERDKVKVREEEGSGPIQAFLANAARTHKVWIVGGSVPLVASRSIRPSDASGCRSATTCGFPSSIAR